MDSLPVTKSVFGLKEKAAETSIASSYCTVFYTEASEPAWCYHRQDQRTKPIFDASYRFPAPLITMFLCFNFNRMEKDLNFSNCALAPSEKNVSVLNAATSGEGESSNSTTQKGMHSNPGQKITNPSIYNWLAPTAVWRWEVAKTLHSLALYTNSL